MPSSTQEASRKMQALMGTPVRGSTLARKRMPGKPPSRAKLKMKRVAQVNVRTAVKLVPRKMKNVRAAAPSARPKRAMKES